MIQNLTQNGENVKIDGKQALLFRPVIHLFGSKNRTLNGDVIQVRYTVASHTLYVTKIPSDQNVAHLDELLRPSQLDNICFPCLLPIVTYRRLSMTA